MVINRSAPSASVVPVLVYEDVAKAVEWLCETCGFVERLRHVSPGGVVTHAQLVIGDGAVMLGSPGADDVSRYLMVRVEDVDGHCERATAGRAHLETACGPAFRRNRWTFSQSIADVDPAAWGAREPT